MRTLFTVLLALLWAGAAGAVGEWSHKDDGVITGWKGQCTSVGPGQECHYVEDGTDNSLWLNITSRDGTHVCLNPDDGDTATAAQVEIWQSSSSATANGSTKLFRTLTGIYPDNCIWEAPWGAIQVRPTVASANNLIVTVRGQ